MARKHPLPSLPGTPFAPGTNPDLFCNALELKQKKGVGARSMFAPPCLRALVHDVKKKALQGNGSADCQCVEATPCSARRALHIGGLRSRAPDTPAMAWLLKGLSGDLFSCFWGLCQRVDRFVAKGGTAMAVQVGCQGRPPTKPKEEGK